MMRITKEKGRIKIDLSLKEAKTLSLLFYDQLLFSSTIYFVGEKIRFIREIAGGINAQLKSKSEK